MYTREAWCYGNRIQKSAIWRGSGLMRRGHGGKRDAVKVSQRPDLSKTANKQSRCSDSAVQPRTLQLVTELPSQHEAPSTPKRHGWCPSIASNESWAAPPVESRRNIQGTWNTIQLSFETLYRHDVEMPQLLKSVLLLGHLCQVQRSFSQRPLESKMRHWTQNLPMVNSSALSYFQSIQKSLTGWHYLVAMKDVRPVVTLLAYRRSPA